MEALSSPTASTVRYMTTVSVLHYEYCDSLCNASQHAISLLYATGPRSREIQLQSLTEMLVWAKQSGWLFNFNAVLLADGALEGIIHILTSGHEVCRSKALGTCDVM